MVHSDWIEEEAERLFLYAYWYADLSQKVRNLHLPSSGLWSAFYGMYQKHPQIKIALC